MSEYGEPWRCSEVGRDDAVFDQYGELIADNLQTGVARRIKCCVNACDGISTSVLELQGVPSLELCKRLEQQRDELLAENETLKREIVAKFSADYLRRVLASAKVKP